MLDLSVEGLEYSQFGYVLIYFGRQHRKYIDLYLKPFRGNNNIINLYTSYEKNVQLSSNKYLLLLLLLFRE